MSVKYTDLAFAQQRIQGTVVRYEGTPVFVDYINEDGEASVCKLGSNKYFCVEDYNDLDLTPVPLGNTNYKARAFYIWRIPMREDWRQGLRERTICSTGLKVGLMTTYLAKTIKGLYPHVDECMEAIHEGEAVSQAFSRNFSLTKGASMNKYGLILRGRSIVGDMFKNKLGGFGYELKEDFSFLDGMLEKELH